MSVVWQPPKRLSSLSRLGTWGLVFAFVLTSLGLPLEEWLSAATFSSSTIPVACAITPGTACQCSPARRRAGRCCCPLVKKTVAKTTGCCAQRTVAKSDKKSCCQAKSPATPTREPTGPIVTNCGCGSDEAIGSLWSGEPRVITVPLGLSSVEEPHGHLEWRDDSPLGTRPRPDVPPPRDQLFSV